MRLREPSIWLQFSCWVGGLNRGNRRLERYNFKAVNPANTLNLTRGNTFVGSAEIYYQHLPYRQGPIINDKMDCGAGGGGLKVFRGVVG